MKPNFLRVTALHLLLLAAALAPKPAAAFTPKELAQGYSDTVVLAVPRASHAGTIDADEAREGLTLRRKYNRFGGLRVLKLATGDTADQAVARLRATGRYEYVEANRILHARTTPNDLSFSTQWSLNNTGQSSGTAGADIGAVAAWNTLTSTLAGGSNPSDVVVAIVDSGMRMTHQDLSGNLWTISGGSTHGVTYIGGHGLLTNSTPADDLGHGTHVAGIIGAVGNNSIGISGVAWTTKMMPLKFLDSSGSGSTADSVACIDYAISNGAAVINASYGSNSFSQSEYNAIASARDHGIIFIAAAGNDSANSDLVDDYPANYALDNIVSVAATDRNDLLASYSNYGSGMIDIAAPGTDIYSTYYSSDNSYQTLSGTSMATPHVTGALALLKARFPTDTYRQLINRLLRSATRLSSLSGKTQTSGRLNLAAAVTSTINRPFNDGFSERATLVGANVRVRSSNVGATLDSGEPAHAGVTGGASLWWSWTATDTTQVAFDTAGSAYDTTLAVYTGDSVSSLVSVGSNDDASSSLTTSRVLINVTAGTTYQIAVDGKNGATGYTVLKVGAVPANDNFANAKVLTGNSVSLTANLLNASSESGEPNPTGAGAGHSIWYKWTAPTTGHYLLSAFATQIDTVAAVYTGSAVGSLTTIASDDNSAVNSSNSDAIVPFNATAGTTYYFQIDHNSGDGTSGGEFTLTLVDAAWAYSANDEITASPAVGSDGTIYMGAGSSNGTDLSIYAINSDGTRKWSYATTTNNSGTGIIGASPTISADGSTVYVGATDQVFYAINASTGARRWSITTTSALSSAAALASDGTVYFRDDLHLYAYTPGTSSAVQKWRFTLGTVDGSYSSPVVGTDGTIYVGTTSSTFYAINAAGSQKWSVTADGDIYTSPAIGLDGTIYFATLNGTVYAYTDNGTSGTKKWSWTTSDNSSITSSIAIAADGTLYFAGYDHKLHALSSSGTEKWSYKLGDEVRASSPAIAADGTVYVGCYDGFVYAINADGTLNRTYATAKQIRSSPIIANSRLYIGSADAKLYAFTLGKPMLSSAWPTFHQDPTHAGRAVSSVVSIATQPSAQTLVAGSSLTLSVATSGSGTLTYQWYKDGVAISGATSATYTVATAKSSDAGSYSVLVSSTSGGIFSSAAVVTVTPTVSIATQPTAQTLTVGQPLTLSVTASSATALSYQWYHDNVAISGATGATYTVAAVTTSDAGSYTVLVSDEFSSVTSSAAVVTVNQSTVQASHLVNISTRAYCSTGDNVTIAGFVVAGSTSKQVLIRAVGPTLSTQGLSASEVLADPTITVYRYVNGTSTVIGSNDNWTDNTDPAAITALAAQVGAQALASTDTTSSAMILTLQPGIYTFIASGKNSTSGIVLLEVYDADTSNTAASFVNISSRADCTTGDGRAIGGFVINGSQPKQVLLRAVGPTLSTEGLGQSEVLADPTISLYQFVNGSSVLVTSNDNWTSNSNSAAITSAAARVGATPLASTDTTSSALLLTLQPGVYTFVASGTNSTTGIVLVEVYDAD